ncbi:MAG: hypothetical protein ACFFDP_13075, partial [Promethearchaeota archaeon]
MKSRYFACLILLVILLPFMINPSVEIPPLISSTQSAADSDNANYNDFSARSGGMPTVPAPDYTGIGSTRPVHEVANRTDSNQDIFLYYNSTSQIPYNDSGSVVLPPGWTGYHLDFSINQLFENRCWVLNPSYNGNTDNWTSGEYDVVGYDNTFSQSWETSGGADGNGYVRVQENGVLSGSYYRYDNNDRTWWRQTYSVNRSDISWVAIKMDYRINSAWGSNALFNVYIRINGSQVWA